MGISVYAKLMYGYPMPEIEYDNEPSWYDEEHGIDLDDAWFHIHGPDEIKALNLTREELDDWNTGLSSRAGEYSEKYSVFLKARREWVEANPCPVALEHVGTYDSDDNEFLVLKHEGKPVMHSTYWEAMRLETESLGPPLASNWQAQHVLDDFCRTIGLDPTGRKVGWYLAPLYSH